ncbi:hypothetical protein [Pseudanabaena mucicola]|nr:hypothetical protein [Pseudanabaena mucicola]
MRSPFPQIKQRSPSQQPQHPIAYFLTSNSDRPSLIKPLADLVVL